MSELTIIAAASPEQIVQVRELFLEYAGSLGFSLCFQSFDQELAGLPGDYAPPQGRLLLAKYDGQLAGCVALFIWAAVVLKSIGATDLKVRVPQANEVSGGREDSRHPGDAGQRVCFPNTVSIAVLDSEWRSTLVEVT